jgi:hypothetical protein
VAHKRSRLASARLNANDVAGVQDAEADKSIRSRINLDKDGLFFRHMGALFKKRVANFRRDKKAWFCTTFLPTLFVLIGFLVFKFAAPQRVLGPITLDLSDYNSGVKDAPVNPIPVNTPENPYACQPGRCVYSDITSSPATNETYAFCGGQASFRSVGSPECTLSKSLNITETLEGFAGALAEGIDTSDISNVRKSRSILRK